MINVLISSVTLLAVAAVTPLVIRRPLRTILPAYAASIPVASVVKLSVPLPPPFDTLSSLLGAGVILAVAVHLSVYRRGAIPTLPVAAWLTFLAWTLLTLLWSSRPGAALDEAKVALPLITLVLVISLTAAERADLDGVRAALIVSGIIVGGYALGLLLTGQALPEHGVSERFQVSSGAGSTDPNILAASLLLPLATSLERLLLGGTSFWSARVWRTLGGAGAFLIVIAVLLTGSRGGLLGMVASIVLTFAFCSRIPAARIQVRRLLVAGVEVVLFVVIAAAVLSALLDRPVLDTVALSPPIQRVLSAEQTTSGRAEIWRAGYVACRRHCGVGIGVGNFSLAFDRYAAFSGASKEVDAGSAAHNVFLSVAVETGVIGLALLLLALAAEWRAISTRAMRKEAPALRASFITLLIVSMFLSAIWFKYFWMVFVVIRLAETVQERERKEALGLI